MGPSPIFYSQRMKVSVTVHVYNHEKFIANTLESIVSQQTTFPFEVIVGDDCSTDGSREIIRAYQEKYPEIIKPLFHPQNLGGYGKMNALATFEVAQGEYIATVDGDDYWIDPLKLQKQIDFLDAHPDFIACFHNAIIRFDDGAFPDTNVNPIDQKDVITVDDLVGEEEIWFIATSSLIFRHHRLGAMPQWFYDSKSGDIPRLILLAKLGPMKYLPDVMSVYRKNAGGLSFTDHKNDAAFLWNRLGMYRGIDQELGFRFHSRLRKTYATYFLQLAGARQYIGTWRQPWYALKSLYLSRPNASQHTKQVLQDWVIPNGLMQIYADTKYRIEKILGRKP